MSDVVMLPFAEVWGQSRMIIACGIEMNLVWVETFGTKGPFEVAKYRKHLLEIRFEHDLRILSLFISTFQWN